MPSDAKAGSTSGFEYYHYEPSFALAIAFTVLFAGASARHLQLLIRKRTWCFIPFLIGCLFEASGYAARAVSSEQTPNWMLMPYIMQSLLILLGPTLYAASIYMILGRLIRNLGGEAYSLVRVTWLTKVFLVGDVLSFLGQSGGGGILATATSESSQNLGNNVILLGLGIQVVFFGFFMVVTAVFNLRVTRHPTVRSQLATSPWQRFIYVLGFASALIMTRSVFRMVEYAQGFDGFLVQTEIYTYALDAVPMLIVAIFFTVWHPSTVLADYKFLESGIDVVDGSDSYPMMASDSHHRRV